MQRAPATDVADVVVVGGGPAGAAAAITLARAGRDVVVVDKARFPRDKCCGDGLTAEALRLLEALGLDPAARARRGSRSTTSSSARRRDASRRSRYPAARACSRRSPGASTSTPRCSTWHAPPARRCSTGTRSTDAHQTTDRVVVDVDGIGELHAHYAVGADGMWSPLRKAVGAATPGYLGEWHAFRQYFTGVGPRRASCGSGSSPISARLRVVVPAPGRTGERRLRHPTIGHAPTGTRRPRAGDEGAWPDLLARPHIASVLGRDARARSTAPSVAHSGARSTRPPLTSGRVLFAGDAACADRSADGRRHRASTRSRGSSPAQAMDAAGPVATRSHGRHVRSRPSATRCSPTIACLGCSCTRVRHRRGAERRPPARVAHPVDGAELRPLAVRGLSRGHSSPRPGRWHRTDVHGTRRLRLRRSSRPLHLAGNLWSVWCDGSGMRRCCSGGGPHLVPPGCGAFDVCAIRSRP